MTLFSDFPGHLITRPLQGCATCIGHESSANVAMRVGQAHHGQTLLLFATFSLLDPLFRLVHIAGALRPGITRGCLVRRSLLSRLDRSRPARRTKAPLAFQRQRSDGHGPSGWVGAVDGLVGTQAPN